MRLNYLNKIQRKHKIAFGLIIVACLPLVVYITYMAEFSNFHTVTENALYRSSAMDMDELEYFLPKENIRSVINLRGNPQNDNHYTDEIEIVKRLNIKYFELDFASTKAPSESDILQLVSAFNEADKPILIHCEAGADRTGLACAIWKLCVEKTSKDEAARQLSFVYGHMPFGETSVLDKFFDNYICVGG